MEVMDYENEMAEEQEVETLEPNPLEEINNDEDEENIIEVIHIEPVQNSEPGYAVSTTETTVTGVSAEITINKNNLDESDVDSDQSCPICMDVWTSSGEHRLCCLRCGHLFGYSCIQRWLQNSCTSANRRCPQCNRKAAVKDIRMLYAKKLMPVDTTELNKLKEELSIVSNEKNRLEVELTACNIRHKLYEQQMNSLKSRISELEKLQSETHLKSNQTTLRHTNKKFHLERSFEICKDGGCRVLDYNNFYDILVASQKSTNTLFPGYGIKKIDCEKFQQKNFIPLHSQVIRDLTFHPCQYTLLLSVGFDKTAKMMDVQNNVIVQTYPTPYALWSCCWSGDNSNIFMVGAQNGSMMQYDIRQSSEVVAHLDTPGDPSPVVSLATVPPTPDSGISRGGFISCHLNTCYAYELKETSYVPKQMFLEGPFVSVCYDEKNKQALVSCRPNCRQPHARHVVCTIEKCNEEAIVCNILHTFNAGSSQQLMSRPCHIDVENDTLIAAHQESSSSVPLWSISTGKQLHSIPVSDPVVDLCSFKVNDNLFLATLSATKLRLYNYG